VSYQSGAHDEFNHRCYYDADNRLREAYTSRDGVIWEKEEKLYYYANGPLARRETGDREVQGTDYAITLQGWVKGINSNTLDVIRDIGKDGSTPVANNNRWFAVDGAAYSLGYFSGDYKAIDATLNNSTTGFLASETNVTNNYKLACVDLFNGNISRMVTSIRDQNGTPIPIIGKTFRYDQLNRIKQATSFTDAGVIANNQWGAAATSSGGFYTEEFSYDGNGNIENVFRNGNLPGAALAMDYMTYHYTSGTNKLTYVDDDPAISGNYTDDIDQQSSGNYDYDAIGNLVKDNSEQISAITWNSQGKIVTVERSGGAKSDLEFLYNAMGQRVCKIEKPRVSTVLQNEDKWIYTIYSRDASGNVMATYQLSYTDLTGGNWRAEYDLKEHDIYSSSRVGIHYDQQAAVTRNFTATISVGNKLFPLTTSVWTNSSQYPAVSMISFARKLGNKAYELANHLGNVLETISDRRIGIPESANLGTATFASGYDGWNAYSATRALVGQRLKVTAGASGTGVNQIFSTVAGTYYSVTFDLDVTNYGVDIAAYDVTTSNLLSSLTNVNLDGTISFGFTAINTTTQISFTANAVAAPPVGNNIFYLDNIYVGNTAMVQNYRPEVLGYSDYYAFGAPMEGRTYVSAAGKYRYGFNGKEKVDELYGNTGDSYDFGARIYDARLAKFLTQDPDANKYPFMSVYCYAANSPIFYKDIDGKGPGPTLYHGTTLVSAEQISQSGFNAVAYGRYSSYNWFSATAPDVSTGRSNSEVTLGIEGIDVSNAKIISKSQTDAWEAEATKDMGYTKQSLNALKKSDPTKYSAVHSEILGRMYSKVGNYLDATKATTYYLERDGTYAVTDAIANAGEMTAVSGPKAGELMKFNSRPQNPGEGAASEASYGKSLSYSKWAGHAILAVAVAVDLYEIHQSNYSTQVILTKVLSWELATVAAGEGAAIGAEIGVWFGGVGAIPGAVIGGLIGGGCGYYAGTVIARTIYTYSFTDGVKAGK